MADFNQPVLSSLYSDMLNILKERDEEALIWMEGSTNTNLPLNAKRWNSSNNYFEKFNGTTWTALTTKYNIDVEKLDGCTVNDLGTAVTDLWTASKIGTELSAKLNSSSYTAADILTKLKTVDGASSGLDADLLDGLHASSTNAVNSIVARDASGNFSAGTITATLSGNASSATTLSGLTATVAELNFMDGVTSNVQTQLNAKLGSTAKAADSALLNGVAEATTATANTIVKRDASGYIYATAVNSTLADTTTAATHYYCETDSDGWLRPKPIANVKAELFASPALTGTPTAPTAATGTNTTQIATTAFVTSAMSGGSAGGSATFTASGTWTCPAGVYTAFVRVLGGGAGGGGKQANYTNPGGGGGSAVENTAVVKVTPGTAYTITIGAGGAGSTSKGGDGGNSSALGILGYGGNGGGGGSSGTDGAGGTGSETPYNPLAWGSGTSGGCAIWMNDISARAAANVAGTLPGQGGGGGVGSLAQSIAGKAGFRGQVYICW